MTGDQQVKRAITALQSDRKEQARETVNGSELLHSGFFRVFAGDVIEAEKGHKFYRPANGVWLVDKVPVEHSVFPE